MLIAAASADTLTALYTQRAAYDDDDSCGTGSSRHLFHGRRRDCFGSSDRCPRMQTRWLGWLAACSPIEMRRVAGNVVQLMYFVCRYSESSSSSAATAALTAEVGCVVCDEAEHIPCFVIGKKISSVNITTSSHVRSFIGCAFYRHLPSIDA